MANVKDNYGEQCTNTNLSQVFDQIKKGIATQKAEIVSSELQRISQYIQKNQRQLATYGQDLNVCLAHVADFVSRNISKFDIAQLHAGSVNQVDIQKPVPDVDPIDIYVGASNQSPTTGDVSLSPQTILEPNSQEHRSPLNVSSQPTAIFQLLSLIQTLELLIIIKIQAQKYEILPLKQEASGSSKGHVSQTESYHDTLQKAILYYLAHRTKITRLRWIFAQMTDSQIPVPSKSGADSPTKNSASSATSPQQYAGSAISTEHDVPCNPSETHSLRGADTSSSQNLDASAYLAQSVPPADTRQTQLYDVTPNVPVLAAQLYKDCSGVGSKSGDREQSGLQQFCGLAQHSMQVMRSMLLHAMTVSAQASDGEGQNQGQGMRAYNVLVQEIEIWVQICLMLCQPVQQDLAKYFKQTERDNPNCSRAFHTCLQCLTCAAAGLVSVQSPNRHTSNPEPTWTLGHALVNTLEWRTLCRHVIQLLHPLVENGFASSITVTEHAAQQSRHTPLFKDPDLLQALITALRNVLVPTQNTTVRSYGPVSRSEQRESRTGYTNSANSAGSGIVLASGGSSMSTQAESSSGARRQGDAGGGGWTQRQVEAQRRGASGSAIHKSIKKEQGAAVDGGARGGHRYVPPQRRRVCGSGFEDSGRDGGRVPRQTQATDRHWGGRIGGGPMWGSQPRSQYAELASAPLSYSDASTSDMSDDGAVRARGGMQSAETKLIPPAARLLQTLIQQHPQACQDMWHLILPMDRQGSMVGGGGEVRECASNPKARAGLKYLGFQVRNAGLLKHVKDGTLGRGCTGTMHVVSELLVHKLGTTVFKVCTVDSTYTTGLQRGGVGQHGQDARVRQTGKAMGAGGSTRPFISRTDDISAMIVNIHEAVKFAILSKRNGWGVLTKKKGVDDSMASLYKVYTDLVRSLNGNIKCTGLIQEIFYVLLIRLSHLMHAHADAQTLTNCSSELEHLITCLQHVIQCTAFQPAVDSSSQQPAQGHDHSARAQNDSPNTESSVFNIQYTYDGVQQLILLIQSLCVQYSNMGDTKVTSCIFGLVRDIARACGSQLTVLGVMYTWQLVHSSTQALLPFCKDINRARPGASNSTPPCNIHNNQPMQHADDCSAPLRLCHIPVPSVVNAGTPIPTPFSTSNSPRANSDTQLKLRHGNIAQHGFEALRSVLQVWGSTRYETLRGDAYLTRLLQQAWLFQHLVHVIDATYARLPNKHCVASATALVSTCREQVFVLLDHHAQNTVMRLAHTACVTNNEVGQAVLQSLSRYACMLLNPNTVAHALTKPITVTSAGGSEAVDTQQCGEAGALHRIGNSGVQSVDHAGEQGKRGVGVLGTGSDGEGDEQIRSMKQMVGRLVVSMKGAEGVVHGALEKQHAKHANQGSECGGDSSGDSGGDSGGDIVVEYDHRKLVLQLYPHLLSAALAAQHAQHHKHAQQDNHTHTTCTLGCQLIALQQQFIQLLETFAIKPLRSIAPSRTNQEAPLGVIACSDNGIQQGTERAPGAVVRGCLQTILLVQQLALNITQGVQHGHGLRGTIGQLSSEGRLLSARVLQVVSPCQMLVLSKGVHQHSNIALKFCSKITISSLQLHCSAFSTRCGVDHGESAHCAQDDVSRVFALPIDDIKAAVRFISEVITRNDNNKIQAAWITGVMDSWSKLVHDPAAVLHITNSTGASEHSLISISAHLSDTLLKCASHYQDQKVDNKTLVQVSLALRNITYAVYQLYTQPHSVCASQSNAHQRAWVGNGGNGYGNGNGNGKNSSAINLCAPMPEDSVGGDGEEGCSAQRTLTQCSQIQCSQIQCSQTQSYSSSKELSCDAVYGGACMLRLIPCLSWEYLTKLLDAARKAAAAELAAMEGVNEREVEKYGQVLSAHWFDGHSVEAAKKLRGVARTALEKLSNVAVIDAAVHAMAAMIVVTSETQGETDNPPTPDTPHAVNVTNDQQCADPSLNERSHRDLLRPAMQDYSAGWVVLYTWTRLRVLALRGLVRGVQEHVQLSADATVYQLAQGYAQSFQQTPHTPREVSRINYAHCVGKKGGGLMDSVSVEAGYVCRLVRGIVHGWRECQGNTEIVQKGEGLVQCLQGIGV